MQLEVERDKAITDKVILIQKCVRRLRVRSVIYSERERQKNRLKKSFFFLVITNETVITQ